MVYSGAQVRALRRRQARLRTKLQAKGTRGAKRRWRARRRKETRCATHVNHTLSNQLVAQRGGTQRGIAREDRTGIRARMCYATLRDHGSHGAAARPA
jgi:hypothetical protein